MSIEQKSSFDKAKSEQSKEKALGEKEKERREINEKIYERMEGTIERIRNIWMRGKKDADYKERCYKYEEEEKSMQKICEFEAGRKEVLVKLMREKGFDFTKGYKRLSDDIVGCDRPDSHEFELMSRAHRKFFGWDFEREYEKRVGETVGRRVIKKEEFGKLYPTGVYYVDKDNNKLFDSDIFHICKLDLGLYEPKYQLGYKLEEFLGGRSVNFEESYFIEIKESIGLDKEAKQFYIKPETAVKDIVGRLRIKEIPTMTSDNEEWLKFYKE